MVQTDQSLGQAFWTIYVTMVLILREILKDLAKLSPPLI